MTYQTKFGNEHILHSTRNCSSKGEACADEQDVGRVPLPDNSFFTWKYWQLPTKYESLCPTWCREYARGFDNQDCPSNQKKAEKQLPQRDLASQKNFGEEKSPDRLSENYGEGITKGNVRHTGECTPHPETGAESLEGEKSLGGAGAWVERFAGANQNCPQEQDLKDRSDCKGLCGVHLEILEQEVGEGVDQTR